MKRHRRVMHARHTVSHPITHLLVEEGVDTPVIELNTGWKQAVALLQHKA